MNTKYIENIDKCTELKLDSCVIAVRARLTL